ncbi:MAG TPA: hypothetical protein VIY47_02025 [Ignavibacteriaceae bacterium]
MSNDLSEWLSGFQDLNPEITEETGKSKLPYKLDLFRQVLPALDRGDKFFYRKLSEEQQEEISPWILMRWMTSAASDKDQLQFLLSVNEFVNNNFSILSPKKTMGRAGHKELQWMLLSLCGLGRSPMRKFVKTPKGAIKNKLEEEFIKFYPTLNDNELELLLKMHTKEDLYNFFKDNGYDDKTIKELLKGNVD